MLEALGFSLEQPVQRIEHRCTRRTRLYTQQLVALQAAREPSHRTLQVAAGQRGLLAVAADVITLAGVVAVMLWMDWELALVTFAVLPLIVIITQWFRRNVRESYRTVRRLIARIEHVKCLRAPQRLRVAADCSQVDREGRALHVAHCPRRGCDHASSASGMASSRSLATSPARAVST